MGLAALSRDGARVVACARRGPCGSEAVDVRDDDCGLVIAEAVFAVRGLLQELPQRSRVLAVAEHPERVPQDESLGPQPEDQANSGPAYGVCGLEVPRGRGLGPRVLRTRDGGPNEVDLARAEARIWPPALDVSPDGWPTRLVGVECVGKGA